MSDQFFLSRLVLLIAGLLCTLPSAVTSAEQSADAACSSAPYRAFDFWLGHWRVHTLDGDLAGNNHITLEEEGCLLVERWRSSQGGTGQSWNYFDPAGRQWHQLWVSRGAIIKYAGMLTADGSMRLEGRIVYQADGRTAPFRGTWTPRADGSVLQVLEEQAPASGEWQMWFTGVYSPVDSSVKE